jgi:hypothetical protein
MSKKPLRLDIKQIQEALQSAEGKLPKEVHKSFQDIAASYASLAELVSDETMTVERLRAMVWGKRGKRSDAQLDRTTSPRTPPGGEDGDAPDA